MNANEKDRKRTEFSWLSECELDDQTDEQNAGSWCMGPDGSFVAIVWPQGQVWDAVTDGEVPGVKFGRFATSETAIECVNRFFHDAEKLAGFREYHVFHTLATHLSFYPRTAACSALEDWLLEHGADEFVGIAANPLLRGLVCVALWWPWV
jgi:hypothetical protein